MYVGLLLGETPDLNSSNCYEREQCHLKKRHDIQLRCFYLMRQNVVTSYELQVVINLGWIGVKRAENK